MIIELKIGASKYKFSCQEGEEEKLLSLTTKLNKRLEKILAHTKNSDEKTLLAIAALMIEEELEETKDSLAKDEEEEFSNQDLQDALSKNMENISDYIESLTRKIQNY